jgi:fatty acid desaturase
MPPRKTATKAKATKTVKAAKPKAASTRSKKMAAPRCEPFAGNSFAFFMILVGFWLLAQELGWINFGISLWPFILIFFGLFHLVQDNQ